MNMFERGREINDALIAANPAHQQALERADKVKEDFAAPGMDMLDSLVAEVETMPIATRFNQNVIVGDSPSNKGVLSSHLNERDFKRQQLLRDLTRIRSKLVILASSLEGVIWDIEATKTEG